MRIGFDVSQTGTGKAGCGYLADSLIQALAELDETNEYLLYPTFGDRFWDPHGPRATRRIDRPGFRVGFGHDSPEAARAFWRAPPADLERRLGAPDVVHSHNFFCPPGLRHARLVYTLYDLGFLVEPEWTTERNRQLCFEGVFDASLHADAILAISEHSRRHFLELFPHYPPERVGVVPCASRFAPVENDDQNVDAVDARDPGERPERLDGLEPDRFLLFVGTLEPRKNPMRLLLAYSRYRAGVAEPLPLVLAGGDGWLLDDLAGQLEGLGIADHVRRLGYVDDLELRWLYRACRAFLYPSLFEGFGMPVVEALSQGAAVVTSDATSLPEVAGDAALLIDPEDEESIRRAIERVVGDDDLCRRLRRLAPAQAARFSWPAAAEEVLRWYGRVTSRDKYAP